MAFPILPQSCLESVQYKTSIPMWHPALYRYPKLYADTCLLSIIYWQATFTVFLKIISTGMKFKNAIWKRSDKGELFCGSHLDAKPLPRSTFEYFENSRALPHLADAGHCWEAASFVSLSYPSGMTLGIYPSPTHNAYIFKDAWYWNYYLLDKTEVTQCVIMTKNLWNYIWQSWEEAAVVVLWYRYIILLYSLPY